MISKVLQMCLVLATTFGSSGLLATTCESARQIPFNKKDIIARTSLVTIYSPRHEDNDSALVAQARWPHPPERLFELVTAYDQFSNYIPRVATSHVLRQERHLVWVYQRLRFPAPMRDRHYVMLSEQHADRLRQHYTVNWSLSDQEMPEDAGAALVPEQLRGCWDIRGTEAGETDAMYFINIEPGGLVPAWLARTGSRHYLSELMQAIEEQLDKSAADSTE